MSEQLFPYGGLSLIFPPWRDNNSNMHAITWLVTFAMWLYHVTYVQDTCTGAHSACRREENGHNLDQGAYISALIRTLTQAPDQGAYVSARSGRLYDLDICVLRRLRLRQGQMQGFLGLKVGGGGLNLQIWDLNRAHETERTVFPILQVFSMCRRKLWHKRKHKGYSTNSAMNTLWTQNTFTINKTCWQ